MPAEAAKGFEQPRCSLWDDVASYHDAFMSQFRKMVEDLKMKEAVEELIEENYAATKPPSNPDEPDKPDEPDCIFLGVCPRPKRLPAGLNAACKLCQFIVQS